MIWKKSNSNIMEISSLTIKLIFILIPGAISTLIFEKLTIRHNRLTPFKFIIHSIIFGAFSYVILQLIFNLIEVLSSINNGNANFMVLETFDKISATKKIPYTEVIWASLISVIQGAVITKLDHYKTINKLANKLSISNKYGDENLFSYFNNSPYTSWVYIRDISNGLTYFGWVEAFSETHQFK